MMKTRRSGEVRCHYSSHLLGGAADRTMEPADGQHRCRGLAKGTSLSFSNYSISVDPGSPGIAFQHPLPCSVIVEIYSFSLAHSSQLVPESSSNALGGENTCLFLRVSVCVWCARTPASAPAHGRLAPSRMCNDVVTGVARLLAPRPSRSGSRFLPARLPTHCHPLTSNPPVRLTETSSTAVIQRTAIRAL